MIYNKILIVGYVQEMMMGEKPEKGKMF